MSSRLQAADVLEAARDLYAVAPGEFIAARNQLVKRLKASGHTDDAAAIGALGRPRLAEWSLNRLAHTDPGTVTRFAHAIAAAQQAQAAAIGGDPTTLRAATAELRDALATAADAAVRGLTGDGGSGSGEAQRDEVTAILRQLVATADPSPLVAGVVGSEAIVSSGELFPGAPEPAPRSASVAEPERPTAPVKPTAAAGRAMARAERLGLHQRAQAAQAAADAAAAALELAQAALIERRRELKAAQAAAAVAQAELAAFNAAHEH